MGGFQFHGKFYRTDSLGYMTDFHEWSEDVASHIASMEGVKLTEKHWEIVNFARDYYKQYKIAPQIRILKKALNEKLGVEKSDNKYLYDLFPKGPAAQACKIGGLPVPPGCVDINN
ncbi:MAG: TusE/DsrC/DsvC family sulfur relay protein [Nitrospinae bacterium]|nr:TusE/DsrC/DsvC family sulfur relay protein [Nitrospinota bacterium]